MSVITVSHALGSYPVHVEPGMLVLLRELLQERLPGRALVMIADDKVNRLYDEWTSGTAEARRLGARASDAGMRPRFLHRLVFPRGEGSKNRATWQRLTDEMAEGNVGRDGAIVAIGGGVTGDLAGFVAATFMRGIPHVQVPTTLLAMVDASVGGKVGVDTDWGKNLVGSFHPPALVVADPLTLMSLPDQEYRGGLAEAIKHGVIADREYLERIATQGRQIRARHPETLAGLVRRSVEIKASVVSQDERDTGRRAILNAGHTVAHAIEHVSGYRVSHGEAVSIGLVVECGLAERMAIAEPGTAPAVAQLIARFGLPTRMPADIAPEDVLHAMQRDKKNRSGSVHCALPESIGKMHRTPAGWTVACPPEMVLSALSSKPINLST
jgi:3-dehydroquinate synthase